MTPARLGRATPAREVERRPLPIMACGGIARWNPSKQKSPLSTTCRYRKTERGGPWGHEATSGLQGRVEPVATACRAECAAVVGAKRAGVCAIGGEAGGDFNGGGCCGAKRSQPAKAGRFCWSATIGVEPVEPLFRRHRRTDRVPSNKRPRGNSGPFFVSEGQGFGRQFEAGDGVLISTGEPLVYWICGNVVFWWRPPAPRLSLSYPCKHSPPSFLNQKKKHHNATKRDLMRLRGLVFWWCCGNDTEPGGRVSEATEPKWARSSAVPSVTFRNGLS